MIQARPVTIQARRHLTRVLQVTTNPDVGATRRAPPKKLRAHARVVRASRYNGER
ncbi:hypothetical protein [Acinetobacter sp.]|uniref:hypothetical protein n=1 Tax=Acinetobacter sp. TaxID=472 RepID=UPI00388D0ED0